MDFFSDNFIGITEKDKSCNKLIYYIKYFSWTCKLNEIVPKLANVRKFITYPKEYDEDL